MASKNDEINKIIDDTENDIKLLAQQMGQLQNNLDQVDAQVSILTNKRNAIKDDIIRFMARIETMTNIRNRLYLSKGETAPPLNINLNNPLAGNIPPPQPDKTSEEGGPDQEPEHLEEPSGPR